MTTPDPFPSELVEAAAKAYDYYDPPPGEDRMHDDCIREALAAVFPLIEQRVNEIEAIVGRTVNDE